jgi:SAM-dependent methyltransferase
MAHSQVPIEFARATGYYLPFRDDYFDAVYHMGGLNTFADIKRAFSEMARVTRPGGRIVIGDESMPPWLRDTQFGKILMNSNPAYRHEPPFADLPVEARNVVLRWIVGGVFYAFEFEVGTGEPPADFDFEIPGRRGGTHRTRFYGQLEGVTPEAKALAERARSKSGKSMHRWLTDAILQASRRELGEPGGSAESPATTTRK